MFAKLIRSQNRDIKSLRCDDIFRCGIRNRCIFVLLTEDLPNINTSEKLESFRFEILLSMFQMLFIRTNLSSEKRGQWRRQWEVVSTSAPLLQIGFNESWKFCLNLWLRGWLKLNLNLVSNVFPWRLWQVKMLFGDGRMNSSIFLLKIKKLSELLTLLSKLFHSL